MKEFFCGLVLLAVFGISVLGYRYVTAPVAGVVQEREIINSGANRIEQYEQYFNQCAAIQGYESSIDVQKELLKTASTEDVQRIKTVIAGITAQRARAIAQYNADVVKYTKNKYFDNSLPGRINLEGKTVCAN